MSLTSPDPAPGGPLALLLDSLNRRDWNRVRELVSEDVRLEDIPVGATQVGWDSLLYRLDAWQAAAPETEIEVKELVETPAHSAAEIVLRGAYTGLREGVPATAVPIELPVAVVCGLQNGAISTGRLYYDLATLLVEVGAL